MQHVIVRISCVKMGHIGVDDVYSLKINEKREIGNKE